MRGNDVLLGPLEGLVGRAEGHEHPRVPRRTGVPVAQLAAAP